jgi:hypothetical protein
VKWFGGRFAEAVGSSSHLTPRRSKGDSNSWSHVLPERWRTDKLRSPVMAVVGAGPPMSAPFTVGLVVRIPFAPAVSLQTLGPS